MLQCSRSFWVISVHDRVPIQPFLFDGGVPLSILLFFKMLFFPIFTCLCCLVFLFRRLDRERSWFVCVSFSWWIFSRSFFLFRELLSISFFCLFPSIFICFSKTKWCTISVMDLLWFFMHVFGTTRWFLFAGLFLAHVKCALAFQRSAHFAFICFFHLICTGGWPRVPYYPFRNNIADHIVNKRRPTLKIE